MSKSDVFDLFGYLTLAAFALAVWPPAALLVFAVAWFTAGRTAHRSERVKSQ